MPENRIIRDPIHSFIAFDKNGIINQLIDTPVFQRLKYIRQLGLSYFTYPSAVHTRFSHSIGTYWLADRIGMQLELNDDNTMKLKLAALLHDIGHSPFSHVLEKKLLNYDHAEVSKIIIEKDPNISRILSENGYSPKEISNIIKGGTMPKYLHNLISGQLDIDRFDYLLRDSMMTGNTHGLFDLERILHKLKINDDDDLYIDKGGWSAVEHYLICRYQMYKQVYNHHTTLSAEELLKKIIERVKKIHEDITVIPKTIDSFLTEEASPLDLIQIYDSDVLNLIKATMNCDDSILKDLSTRFYHRKLFKCKVVKKDKADFIEHMHNIYKIIEKSGFDSDYYFPLVDSTKRYAYTPYSPDPRDQEIAIYIDKYRKKEMSQEFEALRAISIHGELRFFFPEECKMEVERLL